MSPRVLIAGIGNLFLGDDAFGSEVARRLLTRPWPENVRVVDFGIRGIDLAYALIEGADFALFIDATPRGGAPGTLYVIRPELPAELPANAGLLDAHGMDPLKVLLLARSLGASWGDLLLVGCEPGDLGGDDGRMGLSEPVAAALDEAAELVVKLVDDFLRGAIVRVGTGCGRLFPAVSAARRRE